MYQDFFFAYPLLKNHVWKDIILTVHYRNTHRSIIHVQDIHGVAGSVILSLVISRAANDANAHVGTPIKKI